MQNKTQQPVPMLTALLKDLQTEIHHQALNTPKLQSNTLCQQILESNDNSACLNLAITFTAPDTNDACDFTNLAMAIAKSIIYQHASYLGLDYLHSVTQTALLQSNAQTIFNHIEGLNYFNATITCTDCTIYINCIYNQQ